MHRQEMMRRLLFLLVSMLFSSCQRGGLQNEAMMRGFNVLQHQNVAWDDPKAHRSLKRMAALGANAVVFIPFLQQSAPDSINVEKSDAVTSVQLQSGIRYARKLGLHIALKPQILIPASWAGAIDQPDNVRWEQWFQSYSSQIVEQAKFAQQERVQAFVIGTELARARGHVACLSLLSVFVRCSAGI